MRDQSDADKAKIIAAVRYSIMTANHEATTPDDAAEIFMRTLIAKGFVITDRRKT